MTQYTKVRIPNESPLPYVAAFLAFLAAGARIINEQNRLGGPIKYKIIFIFMPFIACLLFSVFAAVLAKRMPQIMIAPLSLVCLMNLIDVSGINVMVYHGGGDILRNLWRYNKIEILLKCILILLVLILGILALSGTDNLPFIILCAISVMANIGYQVWGFARFSHFYVPWYLLYTTLLLGAFIALAVAIQKDRLNIQNSDFAPPPFGSPYLNNAPIPGLRAPGQQMMTQGQQMNAPGQQMNAPGQQMMAQGQQMMMQGQQMNAPGQQMMGRSMMEPVMNQQVPVQTQASHNPQTNIQQESDVFGKINQLYEMNKEGIITNEEFEAKKKELLARIQ